MSRPIKRIQSFIEYILFIGLIRAFGMLPRRFVRRILLGMFDLIGYRIGVRRKVAEIQLRRVFPQKSTSEIRSIIRMMYRNMALSIQEIYLDDDRILLSNCILEGREHIEAALAQGKGAILATGHFGNWEAARIMPLWDIKVAVIAKRQRNLCFDRYTNRIRERNGACVIDMKRGLRGIIEHLHRNELVAILTDQNAGKNGIITDFLGFPASHWKGAAKLAIRHGLPVVPGYVVRDEKDRLVFRFEPVIEPNSRAVEDESCLDLIRKINSVLEKYIVHYPHLWFWVHKRWKHGFDMFEGIK